MPQFPIVGIGSSAGGLEPLQRIMRGMPADCGMAIVVVAHLDPTHKSHLTELLARCTEMKVTEARKAVEVEPNHVYVIAPDRELSMRGNVLRSTRPTAPRHQRYPVDTFFRSLAEEHRERAIAVVLSGTGSNGSHGLRFVKAEGGIVLAQDPETAGFDGMPRAAIGTGLVDLILPPDDIPQRLLALARHPYVREPEIVEEAKPENELQTLFAIVRAQTRREFGCYKKRMLLRRIYRRMGLHRILEMKDYIERLRHDTREVRALASDFTINVTNFFRDPAAWEELRETVLLPLAKERPTGATIRVWLPGCATGEEAYSIAMLITEVAEETGKFFDLKIFATDVVEDVLAFARAARYPSSISDDMSEGRLQRFFELHTDGYIVDSNLRDAIIFAPQDLLQDAPFSRLDLVVCRNLLIYLEPEYQKRVIALFHFALSEGGYLFLGSAESVSGQEELFRTVSKKWRIYRRGGPTRHDVVDFPLVPVAEHDRGGAEPAVEPELRVRARELTSEMLLERFAPPSALVDSTFRVHYLRGDTEPYLRPPRGEPTYQLLAMAREGLHGPLRAALRRALEQGEEVAVDGRVRRGKALQPVRILVTPAPQGARGAGRLLVSFLEREVVAGQDAAEASPASEDQLQAELDLAREELRQTVEQMEASTEELKASNEEIRSINEELQASNEELETSKEELQSLNEELNTVNSQLEAKITELEARTDDLNNLLNSTDIAILFLDPQLRVRWYTPSMKTLLELRPSDVGRPISHFAQRFDGGNLGDEVQAVMERLQVSNAEVADEEGRWYIRHIAPYRTGSDRIEGAVVTFTEITERKRSEEELRGSEERLRKVLDAGAVGVLFFSPDGTLVDCNEMFLQMTGYTRDEVRAGELSWASMTPREWIPASEEQFAKLSQTGRIGPYEKEHLSKDGSRTWMLFAGAGLDDGTLVEYCIDISDRKRAEAERELLASELSHRVKNLLAVVQAMAARASEHTRTVKEFREAFIGRVQALSRAHDLLLDSGWQTADLHKVVEQALMPFTDSGKPLEIEGESTALGPRHGVALSLVLYELATNAAKHGALSNDHGRVRVTWRPEDVDGTRKLHLRWQELGGPPVREPRQKGFGLQLIERACAYELDGETELTFAPDGLVCELAFPLEEGGRSWESAPVLGSLPSARAGS